jgi:type II secretory pathway pseudopilin PulG
MLIATFGPATQWVGKTITYENGLFTLEGYGPIPAQGVLDYDRQGHLVWAYDGLREWVQQVAAAGLGEQPAAQRKRFPVWAIGAIVLFGVGILVVIVGIIGAIAIPAFVAQRDEAKQSSVISGIRSIDVGVRSWAVDNGDVCPEPSLVSPSGVGTYSTSWPTNPYTGQPMTQGTGPGDFRYTVSADGASFELAGMGEDGSVLITVP